MSKLPTQDTISPTVEVQNRVDVIKDYLCTKLMRSQILEKIANYHRDWNVKTGTVDRYIRIAKLQMMEVGRQSHQNLKSEAASDLQLHLQEGHRG
jgi:hypothetical protein